MLPASSETLLSVWDGPCAAQANKRNEFESMSVHPHPRITNEAGSCPFPRGAGIVGSLLGACQDLWHCRPRRGPAVAQVARLRYRIHERAA